MCAHWCVCMCVYIHSVLVTSNVCRYHVILQVDASFYIENQLLVHGYLSVQKIVVLATVLCPMFNVE